ncbi:hypothetical protein Lal_00024379 [Lupinus albus]|nr:hypothetical protein Lal_00024379 [Lupinus albus]
MPHGMLRSVNFSLSLCSNCLWNRQPSDDERFVFVGNGKRVVVEDIGNFVVPSLRSNLISIPNVNKFDFSCSYGNSKVSLYLN